MPAVQKDSRLEALRHAPLDSWVALSPDESTIIAVGATYSDVIKKSDEAGVDDPVILKTPKSWLPLSV